MSGVHKVAYTMVAGAFFWIGTVHQEASKPVPEFRRVSPLPAKAVMLIPCNAQGRIEYERTCRARFRSAKVGP